MMERDDDIVTRLATTGPDRVRYIQEIATKAWGAALHLAAWPVVIALGVWAASLVKAAAPYAFLLLLGVLADLDDLSGQPLTIAVILKFVGLICVTLVAGAIVLKAFVLAWRILCWLHRAMRGEDEDE